MKYKNTVKARFIDRVNRFTAHVELDGRTETVHVKNTGRCKELLIPGADVILSDGMNPSRKTKYDLITVRKDPSGWINIDSQAPNAAVLEWLKGDETLRPEELKKPDYIRPEYTYGDSRVDFYLEIGDRKILLEVKGCTLEINGTGYFPDAPTERGIKHLKELSGAVKQGYECYIAFVIAIPGISRVLPNMTTHPQFGYELQKAEDNGVKSLYLSCDVTEDSLMIRQCRMK